MDGQTPASLAKWGVVAGCQPLVYITGLPAATAAITSRFTAATPPSPPVTYRPPRGSTKSFRTSVTTSAVPGPYRRIIAFRDNVSVVLAEGFLFTDHYQLTMAQLYLRSGLAGRRAQFDHTFRSYPDYGHHQAGYCISAGLTPLLEWMSSVRFADAEADALRGLTTSTGDRLFGDDFVDWMLDNGRFDDVDLWAVPEGRVVHPLAPITVVEAPLPIAQILETPLLNHRNFGTLIATKASRVVESAHGGSVLEFGMRRAHGFGANGATRAALIGGADFSSNAGASLDLGFEPKGTHAHSMIQVFMAVAGGELEAFRAYAEVYPDDCLLLVDTIDTLESGVPNAITVFQELRTKGHEPVGIRLDSGDLAHLAVRSAAMLDAAGFPDCRIVLSSQLDELNIWQIRNQILDEATRYGVDADHLLRRMIYGVGSRMVVSEGDSLLDGVYKTVSAQNEQGESVPALKLSDSPAKSTLPGRKGVWRIYDERGRATADLIALDGEPVEGTDLDLLHPSVPGVQRRLEAGEISRVEPLLQKFLERGRPVRANGNIEEARRRRIADLELLDTGVRRLVNPHTYHVSITPALHRLREDLTRGYRS